MPMSDHMPIHCDNVCDIYRLGTLNDIYYVCGKVDILK